MNITDATFTTSQLVAALQAVGACSHLMTATAAVPAALEAMSHRAIADELIERGLEVIAPTPAAALAESIRVATDGRVNLAAA